jgi:hypothetical protein
MRSAYHDLRREHTAWVQRIHAVFFHQGAPALGEGTSGATGDARMAMPQALQASPALT